MPHRASARQQFPPQRQGGNENSRSKSRHEDNLKEIGSINRFHATSSHRPPSVPSTKDKGLRRITRCRFVHDKYMVEDKSHKNINFSTGHITTRTRPSSSCTWQMKSTGASVFSQLCKDGLPTSKTTNKKYGDRLAAALSTAYPTHTACHRFSLPHPPFHCNTLDTQMCTNRTKLTFFRRRLRLRRLRSG